MDLVAAAIERIESWPGFLDVLPGGVWDRTIKRDGRGSTPEAFDPATKEVRVCASVTSTVADDPSGSPDAAIGVLTIWIRGPESPAGRASVRAARNWIRQAIVARPLTVDGGRGASMRTADFIDVRADPVLDNAVLSTLRMQAAGIW